MNCSTEDFASGMVSEETSERRSQPSIERTAVLTPGHETPEASFILPSPMRLDGQRRASTEAVVEGMRRVQLLDAYDALKAAEPALSYERAARSLGCQMTYLWRLVQRRQAGVDMAPQYHHSGRRRKFPELATLLQIEAVRTKLDALYCATFGASSESAASGRRTGKVSVALQRFAEEPECPPHLADRLRLGHQPREFVAHLRRITPEMEARFRGEKNFKLNGIVSRRDDTVRLPDGRRAELVSGYMIELDDMSSNQPFYVEQPDGTPLLSRQGLYARDLKSGRWLGVELVARPREAYRAEDILRFLRRLMMTYGKFSVLRLERGIWAARSLKGWTITESGAEEEVMERPEMDREEQAKLQDGLQAIGIQVQHVTSAHRKGALESSFNYLQTVLPTYTMDLNNVGRYAGEFEVVAKRVRQVRAGSARPGEICFAPIDVLAERIEKAMTFINRKPRGGDLANTADAEWERDILQRELPKLTEIDLAAFLPEVRERSIDGGRIEVTVAGQRHDFRSDVFSELGHGYRVFLRFDPTEPTLGAAIYNRETSSANHLGLAQGEFVCFARWEMPGPQMEVETAPGLTIRTSQELYGVSQEYDDGYSARRRQEKFVRTAFRALPRPGQPSVKSAEARDGRGNVVRAETQTTTPRPESTDAALPQLPRRRPAAFLPAPTEEQFARKRARLAEDAEAALARAQET